MAVEQAGTEGDNASPLDVEPISYTISKTRSNLRDNTLHPLLELVAATGGTAIVTLLMAYAGYTGVLAGFAIVIISVYAYQKSVKSSTVATQDQARQFQLIEGARILLSGHRSDLIRVTLPRNVLFEPVVFERVYAGASYIVVFIFGILLGNIILIATRRWLPSWVHSGAFAGGVFPTFGVLTLWGVSRVFPTYYRITPGRLDIMRFSPIANRSRILERWNLRTAKIKVAFELPTVALRDDGRETMIRLRGISEPFKFVEALLLGAVSTYTPPPLPDDQLIG